MGRQAALLLATGLTACATGGDGSGSFIEHQFELGWGSPQGAADPVLTVAVGGKTAPFVLDTGTTEFLMTAHFGAVAVHPPPKVGVNAEALSYSIGQTAFTARRFVVIEAPVLESKGWGGLLSPQLIAPDTTVILDFRRMKLAVLAPGEGAMPPEAKCKADVAGYSRLVGSSAKPQRLAWQGRKFGALLVEGAIVGRPTALFDIDTGSAWSMFRPSYLGPATERERPGPRLQFASGAVRQPTEVPDVELLVGESVLRGRTVLASDVGGSMPDGLAWVGSLGMDVLRDGLIGLCPRGDDAVYLAIGD